VAVSLPGFSYLQVSSVLYTWLSLGKAWCRLGVPETLLHSPWDHLQVLRTGLDWVSSISQKTRFMFHAVSVKGRLTSPEMILRALLSCKWAAWEPRIWPCIMFKMHNEVNSVWAQTQISLQWWSSPAWGRQGTPKPGSVQVQVQRKFKCSFPVSLVFSL
jgi:hypothetical protein